MFNLLASDGIAEIVTLSDILQRFFFRCYTQTSPCISYQIVATLFSLQHFNVYNSSPCIDTMHFKNPQSNRNSTVLEIINLHSSLITDRKLHLDQIGTQKKGGKPRLMLFPGMSDKHLGCKLIFIRSLSLFTCSSNQSGAVYLISSVHKQGSDYGH